MTEAKSAAAQPAAGGEAVVLYTQTFKIDGFLSADAGRLVLRDCKVYDRLQKDKFVFGVSQMEVPREAVEVILPRSAITKEGVFSAS